MKLWSSLALAGIVATRAVATEVLSPDAIEKDIEEKK
jgi:hypothetical protein